MERLITVGQVDAGGRRLRTLRIPESAIALARTHGWWVFEDFEALWRIDEPQQQGVPRNTRSQADGYLDSDGD